MKHLVFTREPCLHALQLLLLRSKTLTAHFSMCQLVLRGPKILQQSTHAIIGTEISLAIVNFSPFSMFVVIYKFFLVKRGTERFLYENLWNHFNKTFTVGITSLNN